MGPIEVKDSFILFAALVLSSITFPKSSFKKILLFVFDLLVGSMLFNVFPDFFESFGCSFKFYYILDLIPPFSGPYPVLTIISMFGS